MTSNRSRGLLATALLTGALLLAAPGGAALGASGSGVGPKDSWTENQKGEFNIGTIAGALEICGHYGTASELKQIAILTPYGKKGIQATAAYDQMRGGVCGKIAKIAKEILEQKQLIIDELKGRYGCSDSGCTRN